MSVLIPSPGLEAKSAFQLTRTAQPPCLGAPWSLGQTLHPSSPEGGPAPHLTEPPCGPAAGANQPAGLLGHRLGPGREKEQLGGAPRPPPSGPPGAHTPRHPRAAGRGPGSASAAPPHPRLRPPAPRLPARRPEDRCFALGKEHTPHTRGLGRSSSRRPPRGRRSPRGGPEEDGAHAALPSGQTDVRLLCPCALRAEPASRAPGLRVRGRPAVLAGDKEGY